MQTKGQLLKNLNAAFSFAPSSILSLTIYREDLKKAILANAQRGKIDISEEMKKIDLDCFEKTCKIRDTYKIPNRWFEEDDSIEIEESLQTYLMKIFQTNSIGSKEWKIILSLLKQAVQKEEKTYKEEIFSLIMCRPKDRYNWEWDGVQALLMELIPLLNEEDIRLLIQDIVDRNKECQQKQEQPLSFYCINVDMEYLAYAYNQNTDIEERVRLCTKILDMHEMWITADGMIEVLDLIELKEFTEDGKMETLIERLYQL